MQHETQPEPTSSVGMATRASQASTERSAPESATAPWFEKSKVQWADPGSNQGLLRVKEALRARLARGGSYVVVAQGEPAAADPLRLTLT